jgi:hypothetical protein
VILFKCIYVDVISFLLHSSPINSGIENDIAVHLHFIYLNMYAFELVVLCFIQQLKFLQPSPICHVLFAYKFLLLFVKSQSESYFYDLY